MNAKQRIVAILRREYEQAVTNYRLAHAQHIGIVGAANTWDECNPDDGVGGMSQNPFNITAESNKDNAARIHAENMKEAYDLAVDTFLK